MLASIHFRIFLVLSALASTAFVHAQTQEQVRHLSVQISAVADSVPLGSRIDINLDVTNSSANSIGVVTIPAMGGFEFVVEHVGTALSSQVQMTTYQWHARGGMVPKQSVSDFDEAMQWDGGGGGGISIGPNQTVRLSALLNDLFDIRDPGDYTIHVRKWPWVSIRAGIEMNPKPKPEPVPVDSNTITIKVTAPPPPTISLVLSTGTDSFSPDSPINVDLAVTNTSNAPISLPLDPSHPSAEWNGYRFKGFAGGDRLNSAVHSKFYYDYEEYDHHYPALIVVQPSQTVHYAAQVAKLLEVGSSGSYLIRAVKVDPVTHLKVESNVLTIVVQE